MDRSAAAWGRVLREWIAAGMIGLGLSQIAFGPLRVAGFVIVAAGAFVGAVQLIARRQYRKRL